MPDPDDAQELAGDLLPESSDESPEPPPIDGRKGPRSARAGAHPAAERRDAAKRAALNALRRAKRAVDRAGVELSDWEGEFLESVTQRVKTYGRAFADPDKGAPGTPLSMMQGVKLKEIAAKASGKDKSGKDKSGKDGAGRRFGPGARNSRSRKPFGRKAGGGGEDEA